MSEIEASAVLEEKRTSRRKKTVPTDRDYRREADLFKQISDPTRLKVIALLFSGERNVGELTAMTRLTQPAMSHHLCLLRVGGVIQPRRDGKHNFYGLTDLGRTLAGCLSVLES